MTKRMGAAALALAVALALIGIAGATHDRAYHKRKHVCRKGQVWCEARGKCCSARDCRTHKPSCRKGTVKCGKSCMSPRHFNTDANCGGCGRRCTKGTRCERSKGGFRCKRVHRPYPPRPLCLELGQVCFDAPGAKPCCGLGQCVDGTCRKRDPVCVPFGQDCTVGGQPCCDANAACINDGIFGSTNTICEGCKPRGTDCQLPGTDLVVPCCTAGDVCRPDDSLGGALTCQPPGMAG